MRAVAWTLELIGIYVEIKIKKNKKKKKKRIIIILNSPFSALFLRLVGPRPVYLFYVDFWWPHSFIDRSAKQNKIPKLKKKKKKKKNACCANFIISWPKSIIEVFSFIFSLTWKQSIKFIDKNSRII